MPASVAISTISIQSPVNTGVSSIKLAGLASSLGEVIYLPSAPTIENLSPPNGSELKGNKATIIATVVDEFNPITKVEFYIDNSLKSIAKLPPYEYDFSIKDYSKGEHKIKAVAYNSLDLNDTLEHTVSFK